MFVLGNVFVEIFILSLNIIGVYFIDDSCLIVKYVYIHLPRVMASVVCRSSQLVLNWGESMHVY